MDRRHLLALLGLGLVLAPKAAAGKLTLDEQRTAIGRCPMDRQAVRACLDRHSKRACRERLRPDVCIA